MKTCVYCHNSIPKEALICPMCGSDVSASEAIHKDEFYQATLFEDNPSGVVDATNEEDSFPNSRLQKNGFSFQQLRGKFVRYCSFLWKKMKDPDETRKTRRDTHDLYGYFTFIASALLSAGLITRTMVAFAVQYDLLSQISLFPAVSFKIEPLVWYMKGFLLLLLYYLLFPILSFVIKTYFLHRRHAFPNWMTQFAGMNAFSFVLLVISFVFGMIAPILMAVPVLLLFLIHLMSYLVTFIASLYQTINETKYETLYLCLGGISAHLLIMISIAYLLFFKM